MDMSQPCCTLLIATVLLFLPYSPVLPEVCDENHTVDTEHTCADNATYLFVKNKNNYCFVYCTTRGATRYTWFDCGNDALCCDNTLLKETRPDYQEKVKREHCLLCKASGDEIEQENVFCLKFGEGERLSRVSGPVTFADSTNSPSLKPQNGESSLWSVAIKNINTKRSSYFRLRLEILSSAHTSLFLSDHIFHPFCEWAVKQREGHCWKNQTLVTATYKYQNDNSDTLNRPIVIIHIMNIASRIVGSTLNLTLCSCQRNGSCVAEEESIQFTITKRWPPSVLYSMLASVMITSSCFVVCIRSLCWREVRYRLTKSTSDQLTYFLISATSGADFSDKIHNILDSAGLLPVLPLAGAPEAASISSCIHKSDVQIVVLEESCMTDDRFVCALRFLRCRGKGRHFYLLQASPAELRDGKADPELLEWLQKDCRRRESLKWASPAHCLLRPWFDRQILLCARLAVSIS